MIEHSTALAASQALLSIGLFAASLELIMLRAEFGPRGIFSLSLVGHFWQSTARTRLTRTLARILSRQSSMLFIFLARATASLALLLAALTSWAELSLVGLTVLAGTTLVINRVMVFGQSGADQMAFVVIIGLWVAQLGSITDRSILLNAGAWFVAFQCALAYFTSGLAKLFGRRWRDGTAAPLIVHTTIFGAPRVRRLLSNHAWAGATATYAVLGFELGFPLVFILPGLLILVPLTLGLLFHLSIGAVMGLNGFIPSFLSAYPVLLYCASSLKL